MPSRSAPPIRFTLIGIGTFGRSFLTHACAATGLEVAAICDVDLENARIAGLAAGIPTARMTPCSTADAVDAAIASRQVALCEDALLLCRAAVDVVVESTGNPGAGAAHARAAIEAGKHVVMVTKEVDITVGAALSTLAASHGVVYTQPEGDQPSLLLGLLRWAEGLGLEVICAGKSSESDFRFDPVDDTVTNGRITVSVDAGFATDLWAPLPTALQDIVTRRAELLRDLPRTIIADLCEMGIVANGSHYSIDTPELHAPILRINELADVLRPVEEGGILTQSGVIDVFHCLRRVDEPGFAGGVFVVVRTHDLETWEVLARKGHVVSADRRVAAIRRPGHLLGVETAHSIRAAALDGRATGAERLQAKYDLVAEATEQIAAGTRLCLGQGHAIAQTRGRLRTVNPVSTDSPLPYYLAADQRVTDDIAAGEIVTADKIAIDLNSPLAQLRAMQDNFEKQ